MLKRLRKLIAPTALPVVEQRAAVLAGTQVAYTLKRSARRRSIGLRIDDRGLTVSMPQQASECWLNQVLQDRANWVLEKLDGWQMRKPEELRWADGEIIPFLGEILTLRVGQSTLALRGDELWVYGNETRIERLVTLWYRRQAAALFAVRVAHYAALLNVTPVAIKISTAKTRWGSCTSNGVVRLNLQLIKLPQYLIDYVVVHELAHLHQMNHSAAFWQVVSGVCPDYAKLRRELKAVAL
ncbi:MAG: SprT family zinc-dependent metalloprotease [Proteobacteria bacterium]|nr:SprT family zinc-dependent metalloprotease [Pseudomonadota bacterium]